MSHAWSSDVVVEVSIPSYSNHLSLCRVGAQSRFRRRRRRRRRRRLRSIRRRAGWIDARSTRLTVDALVRGVRKYGGKMALRSPVEEVVAEDGRAVGTRFFEIREQKSRTSHRRPLEPMPTLRYLVSLSRPAATPPIPSWTRAGPTPRDPSPRRGRTTRASGLPTRVPRTTSRKRPIRRRRTSTAVAVTSRISPRGTRRSPRAGQANRSARCARAASSPRRSLWTTQTASSRGRARTS
eukprot:31205-Pelagococcus_subviridis.AAC.4